MNILIVEDEEILLDSLSEKFGNEKFKVIKAKDGQDGLKKALENHPDVILLDILMPKMDGVEMLRELRKDDWGSHAKVIILTNLGDTEKVAEVMRAGLDGSFTYLVKTDQTLDSILGEVNKIIEK